MKLEGSCHCQAVRFTLEAPHPVPYNRCYCSICRKTAGGGGFAINLGARAESLKLTGADDVAIYRARMPDGSRSAAERHFCRHCGSALYLYDARWPELIHPHASAIDTPLPVPPARVHMMLDGKPGWVEPDIGERDSCFTGYPDMSLEDWHKHHGVESG